MANLLQRTLPAEQQPRLFDAILDRIELAIQEDGGREYGATRYRVSGLARYLPRSYPEFDDKRLMRLRQPLMDLLEGCTAVDKLPGLSFQPEILGRVADREAIDFLLAEQARRPVTVQHRYVASGLGAALEVVDQTDRRRILDAWREALAETRPSTDDHNREIRESGFTWAIIRALGGAADPEGIELLLEEQAERPITERHQRAATALSLAAEHLSEPDQQRIQKSWIEIVRDLKPPFERPQQEFVAHVALYLTEKPFSFGPNEQATFRQVLKSIPEEHYRSQVEEALRKASER
jgi:hypothetical protein